MTFGRRTPRNSDPAQSDPHERSPLASASAYPGVEEMPEGPQENVPVKVQYSASKDRAADGLVRRIEFLR